MTACPPECTPNTEFVFYLLLYPLLPDFHEHPLNKSGKIPFSLPAMPGHFSPALGHNFQQLGIVDLQQHLPDGPLIKFVQDPTDLRFHRAHLHTADPADVAAGFPLGQQIQKLQLGNRQVTQGIEQIEKAALVLLYPPEFRADFPGNFRDADAPALEVANWILGGGTSLSSRLMERLRQKEGLSYSVYSQILLPGYGNRAAWIAYAIVAPQNLAKAEKSMRDEITKALEKGFTKQEVSEAIQGLLQSRAVNRAQDAHLARSWITFLETGTDFTESKRYEDRLRALDVNAVNAALRKMLKSDEITFALAGDLAKARKAGADFSVP